MSQVKFRNNPRPFKQTLDARVKQYFDTHHLSEKGNRQLYIKSAVLLPLTTALYLTIILLQPAVWISIVLCVLLGFVLAFIGFNIMHDAAHGSYSSSKALNEIMSLTLNLMGGNAYIWKVKHNIVHHTYTNIAGEDEDIHVPILRLSPDQPRRAYHRYQHIYAPLLYMFTSLIWVLFNDYYKYFSRKVESTPIPPMSISQKILFWGSKLLNLSLFLFIPAWIFGWIPAVVGLLIMHASMGITLALVFQMAHCVEDTQFPMPNPSSHKIENEWALHEAATTANFGIHSRVLTWLLGGLNFQIEHHLFPRISHVHYPAISPIVRQVCREFSVPYVAYPSFAKAVRSHLYHLKQLGQPS
ncbi:MAG: acyl-CoA desaturase [Thermoflavifilum sp.]|nr:acyl-CoA desaturase [Thermoflavifilum sp.]